VTDCSLSGPVPHQLRGCDLSGKNLAGMDLTNAQLQNAKLFGTRFAGVVSMAGADLTGAVMGDGTDFSGCDLTSTQFGPAPNFGSNAAKPTRFVGATVPHDTLGTRWNCLNLTDVVIVGTPPEPFKLDVTSSNLTRFTAVKHILRNAHFYGVVLREADFSGGVLSNVVFAPAQGVLCDLSGARFTGADLSGAVFDTSTLTGTDFSGATLRNASFLQCHMEGTRFDRSDVSTCSFSTPPRFSQNPLNPTSFRGAMLAFDAIDRQWSYLDLSDARVVGLHPGMDLTYLQADYAVLTGMDFSNYTLDRCSMTGATLTGVNFTNAKLRNAAMRGVKNVCALFHVPNTSADYQTLLNALQRKRAADVAAVFARNGCVLSSGGAGVRTDVTDQWWTVTDASTSSTYPVTRVSSDAATYLSVMDARQVTRFDGATLTYADFTPNKQQPTTLRGATFNGANMDHADLTLADLGPVNPYDRTTAAQLKGASLNNAGLSQVDLTAAQLTGTVYLHNADLVCARLRDADLTGAQLGELSELFRVDGGSEDFKTLAAALRANDPAGVAVIFGRKGHSVPAEQLTIATTAQERSWTIVDASSQTKYTALNWTSSDNTSFLIVSTTTQAATLSGAYMRDATLVDANLHGVSASRVQLYGDGVRLDGAILDGCLLSGANLSSASIVVKALYNVDLTGANLINAKLTGADLTNGVTLAYANLHGADFTDTQMNGAKLPNAAVSVALTPTIAGTHLFSIGATDKRFQALLAELRTAGDPKQKLNLLPGEDPPTIARYVTDLNAAKVASVRPLFEARGVTLPDTAALMPTSDPVAWRLVCTPTDGYNVWRGFDDLGELGLFAAPNMPNLSQTFQEKSVAGVLRWQATVSNVGGTTDQWTIDNDSDNPDNMALGYATLLVRKDGDDALAFYGTRLRIVRLSDGNQQQIRTVTYPPTVLCRKDIHGEQRCGDDGSLSYFGENTICPNGATLRSNRQTEKSWEQMLRALPTPTPPKCIPSPYAGCPEVSLASVAASLRRRH
jgi:uncharacterized protein YjbI with pentapeptide repeats